MRRLPPPPPPRPPAPPPPVVVLVAEAANIRLKVGTLKAGAAKSVWTLRLTAPGTRSTQMLKSAAARRLTLLLAVVVPPVVPPPPVVDELAVPPMVRLLPKSKTGPSLPGITPEGVSIGAVEGVRTNGKE